MRYFASNNLSGSKPLLYKTGYKNTYWYSYDQKKWIATRNMFPVDAIERGQEVTKEQIDSFLYMRELVT